MTQPAAQTAVTPAPPPERVDRFLARTPVYPLLFALWPVLRLYGDNAKEFSLDELLVPLVVAVVLALAALVSLSFVWREPRRAALVATSLVLPFLTYRLIALAVAPVWPHEPEFRPLLMAAVVWLGLLIVAAYTATKLRARLGLVTEALNLLSLTLVVVALVPIASHELSVRSADSGDPITTAVAAGSETTGDVDSMRDIYHIVLDRYGSDEALAIGEGIDNSAFTDWLRERGFQVASDAHANFERTALSLASTFDMSLLDDLAERMGPDNPSWGPLYDVLKASPVGSLLQDLGYRYVHVGSWYYQTASSDTADQVVRPVHLVDLRSVLLDQSAVGGFVALADVMTSLEPNGSDERLAETTLTQLEHLHEVSEQDGPKYVFTHLLVPHSPYLLLGDGTFAPDEATFSTQLEFANTELAKLIERLLDGPPEEHPIIILQADEGPYPAGYEPELEDYDWSTARDEDLVTKFGVLNAMYLPGVEGADPLPTDITLVNTYPEILTRYFDLDVERAEDRSFVSTDSRPWDRTEITERLQQAERTLAIEGSAP